MYRSTARVHSSTFLAVQWTLAGVALCFLIFRLSVRLKSFAKLLSDDYLVLLAYSTFLVNDIMWQFQLKLVYDAFDAATGRKPYTDGWWIMMKHLHRSMFAASMLCLCCLWAVKLSFLLFFRKLGQRAKDFRVWWRCVLGMTIAAWIISIAVFPFNCFIVHLDYGSGYCQRDHLHHLEAHYFRISTALDIFTDILVSTVPITMLWRIQLPLRTKLLLSGIFFLTIIVMIIALVRLLVIPSGAITTDITWMFIWSNVEMAASIIVACLGYFRQIYTHTHGKRKSVNLINKISNPHASRLIFLSAFDPEANIGVGEAKYSHGLSCFLGRKATPDSCGEAAPETQPAESPPIRTTIP